MNANEKVEYEWAPASKVVKVILCVIVVLAIAGMTPSCFPPSGDGEARMTRVTLGNLQMMNDELEQGGESAASVRELIAKARPHDWSRQYLATIPAQMTDGATVRDAWGNEIIFVPAFTDRPGMPKRVHAYFMSSGPDGDVATTQDNVYSYMTIK